MAGINRRNLVFLALLSAVCLGAYYNSLFGEFVFDDLHLVKTEDRIEKLENIPRLLNPFSPSYLTYRPIRTISYAIDYSLFGKNPLGFHLSNIFYHIVCCWLVFLLAQEVTGSFLTAAATTLLFALHPIHTEAVSYISGRRDLLSSLFFFLGLYQFIRFRSDRDPKRIIAVFLAFGLGVLSKEMAVTLPAILFLYDWKREIESPKATTLTPWYRKLFSSSLAVWKKNLWIYLPIVALALFFICYYLFITPSSTNLRVYWGGSPYFTFLTTCKILTKYLQLLLVPWYLIADYNSGQVFPLAESLFQPLVFLSVVLVFAMIVVSLREFAKGRLYGFCGLFFFITLLPVCHIIPHHELMSEHFLYLPSLGFCLALGYAFERAASKPAWLRWAYLSMGLLLILYTARTILRNQDWKDEFTLWQATRRDAPLSMRAHTNLGLAYLNRKEYGKAIESFQTSLQIPVKKELGTVSKERAWQNLGVAYQQDKNLEKALECYRQVIQLNPANFVTYLNISALEFSQRNYEEAITNAQKAIAISPESKEATLQLAICYSRKDPVKAIATYQQLIELDRGTDFTARAHFSIGMIYYYQIHDYQQASYHFEIAGKMNPEKYGTEKWLGKPDNNAERIVTPATRPGSK